MHCGLKLNRNSAHKRTQTPRLLRCKTKSPEEETKKSFSGGIFYIVIFSAFAETNLGLFAKVMLKLKVAVMFYTCENVNNL